MRVPSFLLPWTWKKRDVPDNLDVYFAALAVTCSVFTAFSEPSARIWWAIPAAIFSILSIWMKWWAKKWDREDKEAEKNERKAAEEARLARGKAVSKR